MLQGVKRGIKCMTRLATKSVRRERVCRKNRKPIVQVTDCTVTLHGRTLLPESGPCCWPKSDPLQIFILIGHCEYIYCLSAKLSLCFAGGLISGPEFVRQEKTSPPAHPQLFHGTSYDRIRRFSPFANYNFL